MHPQSVHTQLATLEGTSAALLGTLDDFFLSGHLAQWAGIAIVDFGTFYANACAPSTANVCTCSTLKPVPNGHFPPTPCALRSIGIIYLFLGRWH